MRTITSIVALAGLTLFVLSSAAALPYPMPQNDDDFKM